MKFSEIPQRLHPLLHAPDPIVIHHVITVDQAEQKKTACYDIDVEVVSILIRTTSWLVKKKGISIYWTNQVHC